MREKIKDETRFLPVQLAEEERAKLGEDIADLTAEIVEKQARMAADKDRVKVLDGARAQKSETRRRGWEDRTVRCEAFLDGTMYFLVRVDTSEVVETRPATPEERQAVLIPPDSPISADDLRRAVKVATVLDVADRLLSETEPKNPVTDAISDYPSSDPLATHAKKRGKKKE
jgi:hypothetical protein